jgi:hypothetical protein
MAGTTISSSTTVGVTLTIASQNPVTVSSTGTVNVSGTGASAVYGVFGVTGTIANDGLLTAAGGYGIKLVSGGTITNGSATDTKASISGGLYGVRFNIHGAGTLHNFGTISNTSTTTGAGVRALGGGTIVNGSSADTVASISGYFDGVRIAGSAASVINFGKIAATGTSTTIGFGSFGIYFQTGGTVTNGSATDTAASITGVTWGIEIEQAPGTITNFGTIRGTGTLGRGIVLGAGGSVTNGSTTDTAAYIAAADRNGIYIGGTTSSTVSNFGTIKSLDTITGASGVAIRTGGTVTNGTATDTKALISGGNHGVYIEGARPSAVINFGTIASLLGSSISLYLGGNVTNGSAGDTAALITGRSGISAGGPATVINFGTITGVVTNGVYMADGGTIINGSATDKTALIASAGTTESHSGIYNRTNQATITNFGTIKSPTASAVNLDGGTIVNGSTTDTTALIATTGTTGSHPGISIRTNQATITNFGTVKSPTASAIHLNDGGTIVNGNPADTTALIVGSTSGSSIYVQGTHVVISNFATIGSSVLGVSGIFLGQGGSITNGSAADTKASIIGGSGTVGSGIFVNSGTALVGNFGTISGGGSGVNFGSNGTVNSTGTVVNGSAADTSALIVGSFNGISAGNSITVSNFATIKATTSTGVFLGQGGSVTNGSAADTKAAIVGSTGSGIFVSAGTVGISNFGTIAGATGIGFGNGTVASVGTVVNGSAADTSALIIGNNGTFGTGVGGGSGTTAISNFGTIKGANTGIVIGNGTVGTKGTVVNGSAADTVALITGGTGTVGTGIFINSSTVSVSNFGIVNGAGTGINFGTNGSVASAGTVVNGSAADTSALIVGSFNGIFANNSITVSNFATIKATTFTCIFLGQGGSVTNGSAADTIAAIAGGTGAGIFVGGGTADVSNFGTITGGIGFGNGTVSAKGTVVNGSTADTSALIIGNNGTFGTGVSVGSGTTGINNFGTIKGVGAGIGFGNNTVASSGTVVNGSAADTVALITGGTGTVGTGIFINSSTVSVSNFGTVNGAGTGINFGTNGTVASAGTVVNGSTADTSALIVGNLNGIFASNSITVSNFAAIKAAAFTGIFLGQGGSVTNGSAADTKAVISSAGTTGVGVLVNAGQATVTNFGTITSAGNSAIVFSTSTGTVVNAGSISTAAGAAGTAIQFGSGAERLVLRPGSSITGKVFGGSGTNTLELASGGSATTGSIGSQFTNFGTVVVDAGANWTLTGVNNTATVTNNGTLSEVAGGTLQVMGAVDPASTGIFQLNNTSILELSADKGASNQMKFLGAGEVIVDQAANFGINVGTTTYTGPLIKNFVVNDKIDLKDVAFNNAILNYSTATGLLQVTSGGAGVATLAFQNSSLGAGTFHPNDDGTGHLLITHS